MSSIIRGRYHYSDANSDKDHKYYRMYGEKTMYSQICYEGEDVIITVFFSHAYRVIAGVEVKEIENNDTESE